MKSRVEFNKSKAISYNDLIHVWKKYFKKKKERDETSIYLSTNGYSKSKMSTDSNSYYKESDCYERKVTNKLYE